MSRRRGILLLIVLPAIASVLLTVGALRLFDKAHTDERILIMPTMSSTSQPVPQRTQVGSFNVPAEMGDAATGEQSGGQIPSESGACENVVHLVASGETLGAISRFYDIDLDAIIEANQIADPDFDPDSLDIDQEIIVPICGLPTPVSDPTNTPRPIPTPIPTLTPSSLVDSDVIISRIAGVGELYNEIIEIYNDGATIDLEGWEIRVGEDRFVFPAIRLFSGGSVQVHTSRGDNTASDLYWGLTSPVLSVGAMIELIDDEGGIRDVTTIE